MSVVSAALIALAEERHRARAHRQQEGHDVLFGEPVRLAPKDLSGEDPVWRMRSQRSTATVAVP